MSEFHTRVRRLFQSIENFEHLSNKETDPLKKELYFRLVEERRRQLSQLLAEGEPRKKTAVA